MPLDAVCPQRFRAPLAPPVAARQEGRTVDSELLRRGADWWRDRADVLVVDGAGGLLSPLTQTESVADLARDLGFPLILVARPGLGTINHTLLTVQVLRAAKVRVAGVVINQYPTDLVGPAEETNPRAIQRWGDVPVLCVVPNEPVADAKLPAGIVAAIETVDWERLLSE